MSQNSTDNVLVLNTRNDCQRPATPATGRLVQIAIPLVLALAAASHAGAERVIGWVEKAHIPAMDVTVKSKMDTGALTSSIHATNVERFSRAGEKWVRFTVTLEDTDLGEMNSKTLERPVHRRVKLTGAGGVDHRLVVFMDVCFGDVLYREQFSLSDRSDKIYGLLIGRRTIEHLGLLDVTKTFSLQPACKTR